MHENKSDPNETRARKDRPQRAQIEFPRPPDDVWELNNRLEKIASSVPDEELEKNKLFFKDLGKRTLERCNSCAKLFHLLREREFISRSNILCLIRIQYVLSKPELIEEAANYCIKKGNVVHYYIVEDESEEHIKIELNIGIDLETIEILRNVVTKILYVPLETVVAVEPSSSPVVSTIIPDVHVSVSEKRYSVTNESSKWKYCIQSKDVEQIRNLLRKGSRPNSEMLQYAYNEFRNEKKDLIKEICLTIEEDITSKDDNIVSTHACYKYSGEEQIVFVVLTKAKDHLIDIEYPLHLIGCDDYNVDNVIDREREEELSFDGDEYSELTDCLRTNSPDLMEKHSNLTNTSISHFKSSKDMLTKTTCVVFYVLAKGYIPVGEELLPSNLESPTKMYPTDVREGQFALASGGPDEMHTNLKIGCRIESSTVPDGGTIGTFVNHPKHGLCAMTCSHVLLDIANFQKIYLKEIEMDSVTGEQCFQPTRPHMCGEIVDVKLFCRNDRNCGMDIAFVKVDESRKPKTNKFPDILENDLRGKPTQYIEGLLSNLQYNSTAVMQRSNNEIRKKPVVKYGYKSKLTSGKCANAGVSVRLEFDAHSWTNEPIPRPVSRRSKFFMTDQIEIRDDGMKFSAPGDSGAMVFITDGKNELTALGILTGRIDKAGITYITPIWNILEEIKMPLPYSLAEYNPVSEILDRLERSVSDLEKLLNA